MIDGAGKRLVLDSRSHTNISDQLASVRLESAVLKYWFCPASDLRCDPAVGCACSSRLHGIAAEVRFTTQEDVACNSQINA
jgi:hypothetical protein